VLDELVLVPDVQLLLGMKIILPLSIIRLQVPSYLHLQQHATQTVSTEPRLLMLVGLGLAVLLTGSSICKAPWFC
jgi:hypothetical protein